MLNNILARPFIVLTILLIAGYSMSPKYVYLIFSSFLLTTSGLFFYYKHRTGAWLSWIPMTPVLLLAFYLRNQIHQNENHSSSFPKAIYLENYPARILQTELKKNGSQILISCNYYNLKFAAILRCEQRLDPVRWISGNTLFVTANLQRIEPAEELESFNYETYLDHNHIQYKSKIDSCGLQLASSQSTNIFNLSSRANFLLQDKLRKSLNDPELSSLLIGILLGDKSEISDKLKQQFIKSGTAHILAVSGMHIGMLYAMILAIFKLFISRHSKYNFLRVPFTISLVWAFSFLTGLGSSIIRAAVMFSFLEFGLGLRKKTDSVNIICASAFFMIFVNPCLLFDIGLQLSFFAVLSIILFYPLLRRMVRTKNKFYNSILDTMHVCVAVQFLITPISLYHFHCFPTYFILSNLIWVPLSFALMIAGISMVSTGFVLPGLAGLIGIVTSYLLKIGILVFDVLEKLPFAQISEVPFETTGLILALVCIASVYSWIQFHHKTFMYVSLICACLYSAQPLLRLVLEKKDSKALILYKFSNEPLADLKFGNYFLSILPNAMPIPNKTFFQNQHPFIRHEYISLPSTNKMILELTKNPQLSSKLTICIDSTSGNPSKCNIIILRKYKLKLDSICNVNDLLMVVSPQANPWIKKYYTNYQTSTIPQLVVPEFHSFSIKL